MIEIDMMNIDMIKIDMMNIDGIIKQIWLLMIILTGVDEWLENNIV